jgi:predicted transcriptional regulator
MTTTTVRITEEVREALRQLSEQTGESMQKILADAVEAYQRRYLLEMTNAAYAELRSDPEAWQEELQERAEWSITLNNKVF